MINVSKSFGGAKGSAETKSSKFLKKEFELFKIVIPLLQNHHLCHLQRHEYCLHHQSG